MHAITPPVVREGCSHVYYFYPLRYDQEKGGLPRNLFVKAVNAEGYYLRQGYMRPMYLEPMYKYKLCFGADGFPFMANPRNEEINYLAGLCPVCERLEREEVALTNITYPPLSESDMDGFVEAIKKVLYHADEIATWAEHRS